MNTDRYAQTYLDMHQLGWFGQSSAFWRWVKTEEALPYVKVCAAMRRPIGSEAEPTDAHAEAVISDADKLDELAAWIEATFADEGSSTAKQSSIDRH